MNEVKLLTDNVAKVFRNLILKVDTEKIYRVLARETISTLTSAKGFSAANIPPARTATKYAVVQAVDADVRFTLELTTPTSSLGLRLVRDASVEIWGSLALQNFRVIDDGGTAKLEAVYMGES